VGFDESIRVRRYLCRSCQRTVSLLPHFALPYLRFSISVIATRPPAAAGIAHSGSRARESSVDACRHERHSYRSNARASADVNNIVPAAHLGCRLWNRRMRAWTAVFPAFHAGEKVPDW